MAVSLVLLATMIVMVNGRPELTDEQQLLDTITTTTHCLTTFTVDYPEEEGELPYPWCSSRCLGSEELWIDGVVFKRLPELQEYGLMVEMIYINGSLHDCKMVPYKTGEEATAEQEAQKRCMDSSEDEPPIPIHKSLEGFTRLGNSYYMVSPEVMTRHDAVPYCERLGATISSGESSQEQNLLKGILATGVWTARAIVADESSRYTTYSNALCEHPLEDDLNQYSCPNDYWKYKSSCYTPSNTPSTYSEGEKFCYGIGAYPVFINSAEEDDFLKEKFVSHFIGYTDIDVEGTFVSNRFGPSLFTRWAPGEPNDYGGTEDCVVFDHTRENRWNDVPCELPYRMLCEHPLEDDLNQYTCPNGFWNYKSSCYTSSYIPSTYSEGEKFCSGIGAYPVFINSAEEDDFLKEHFVSHFIGYTDIDVEGKFVSNRFGPPLFTRWAPDEPNDNDGTEDCVIYYGLAESHWNDVPCHFKYRMVCEKSAEIADYSL